MKHALRWIWLGSLCAQAALAQDWQSLYQGADPVLPAIEEIIVPPRYAEEP